MTHEAHIAVNGLIYPDAASATNPIVKDETILFIVNIFTLVISSPIYIVFRMTWQHSNFRHSHAWFSDSAHSLYREDSCGLYI